MHNIPKQRHPIDIKAVRLENVGITKKLRFGVGDLEAVSSSIRSHLATQGNRDIVRATIACNNMSEIAKTKQHDAFCLLQNAGVGGRLTVDFVVDVAPGLEATLGKRMLHGGVVTIDQQTEQEILDLHSKMAGSSNKTVVLPSGGRVDASAIFHTFLKKYLYSDLDAHNAHPTMKIDQMLEAHTLLLGRMQKSTK